MRYAVLIERGDHGYGAYVPDLPGCVAVGSTERTVKRRIRGAIALHLEGLRAEGLPIPEPKHRVEYVEAG